MARPVIPLTPARLRESLHYNPETGEFRWLQTRSGRHGPVGVIERVNEHYSRLIITIDYGRYKAHQLAWFYMTGEWPACQIDHEDQNPLNNAWANLRLGTGSINQNNRRMLRNNTSGTMGVFFDKSKKVNPWRVIVCGVHGGVFATKEQAIEEAIRIVKERRG